MEKPLALFDLDNTLIDRLDAFRRWAGGFALERGLDEADVAWMIELDADGALPMDVFFARVRERFGLVESVEELWDAYRQRLPELVVCPRPVLDGLARLRASGWRVGIITNGRSDNQTGKIRRSGLAGLVDGWAISGAEGFSKPDSRLFAIAAERAGAALAHGGWMVGDGPDNDIVGGRAAGLRTIWVPRGRTWPEELDPPDHIADAVGAVEFLMAANPPR